MRITTLTSREFNQDSSRAKKAALEGPVFITDHGQLAHVLFEYQRLTGASTNIIDQLAAPGVENIDFNPPRATAFTIPSELP